MIPIKSFSEALWRGRKKLAIWYAVFMMRFFPGYVERSIANRKGHCLASKCPDLLICCGYCKWLKNGLCSRYEARPIGCRYPPIDPIYQWIANTKKCGFYWEKEDSLKMHIYPPYRCYQTLFELLEAPFLSPKKFDAFFKKWLNGKPYICTYRARNGIYHVLMYLKRKYHVTRVFVPGYICKDVVVPIKLADLEAIFIDIDPKTLGTDLGSAKLKPNDVIIYPNLFGLRASTPKNLAKKRIFVIEDNASSFLRPSHFADFTIYSFGKGKEVSSSEGGMVVVNKEGFNDFLDENKLSPPSMWLEIARYLEYIYWRFRAYGPTYFLGKKLKTTLSKNKPEVVVGRELEGKNLSMCRISKNIAIQQLKRTEELRRKSRTLSEYFMRGLNRFEGITIIKPPKDGNYFWLNLFVKERNSLKSFLEDKRIFTSVPWGYLIENVMDGKPHRKSSYTLAHILQILIDPTRMKKADIMYILRQISAWQNK